MYVDFWEYTCQEVSTKVQEGDFMSIQVNPLTTMNHAKHIQPVLGKNKISDQTTDLRMKQQQLQNTLLLMKSIGSDSGVSTIEQQEKLKAALEKVSQKLQAARNDMPQEKLLSPVENGNARAFSDTKLSIDTYEKGTKEVTTGIYQLKQEENLGYHISFVPYNE